MFVVFGGFKYMACWWWVNKCAIWSIFFCADCSRQIVVNFFCVGDDFFCVVAILWVGVVWQCMMYAECHFVFVVFLIR